MKRRAVTEGKCLLLSADNQQDCGGTDSRRKFGCSYIILMFHILVCVFRFGQQIEKDSEPLSSSDALSSERTGLYEM